MYRFIRKELISLESMKLRIQKSGKYLRLKTRDSLTGFTLIEVLVSVAIIVALVTVIIFFSREARQQAAFTRAKAEAEELATGAVLFFQEKGRWAADATTIQNAEFYDPKYIDINYIEPSSYLGPNYTWDWQNWGNSAQTGPVFPSQPSGAECWQSIDLYHNSGVGYNLALRKCIRDICSNQKYCDESGMCYATASDRDARVNPLGNYKTISASAVCEPCTDEASCARMFQPH